MVILARNVSDSALNHRYGIPSGIECRADATAAPPVFSEHSFRIQRNCCRNSCSAGWAARGWGTLASMRATSRLPAMAWKVPNSSSSIGRITSRSVSIRNASPDPTMHAPLELSQTPCLTVLPSMGTLKANDITVVANRMAGISGISPPLTGAWISSLLKTPDRHW